MMRFLILLLTLLILVSLSFGHITYTGRSGAPGTQTCASSCHGVGTGSMTVSGFPTSYTPGQAYTVTVTGNGTDIDNFNASARIDAGTTNGGVISGGTATSTYNVGGETNGVHFTTGPQPSGTFVWTAPGAGTGPVRLYIAGHQGTVDGPNNSFVFIADEASLTPNAPAALVVSADQPLMRLNWNSVPGAARYKVYRAPFGTPPGPSVLIATVADTTYADSTALTMPDTRAFYVVTASNP